ncbi:hypothetical protein C8Q78DRAFT_1078411 [Trametes maxima]|nr:hypothetical protein C8Q78DRAFT_1078411 [Trametes maxima]
MRSFAPTVAILVLTPVVLGQTALQIGCDALCAFYDYLGGGQAPYFLSLIPGGQPSAPAMEQFPPQNGTSMTWVADLSAGTTFTISIRDASGQQAFSDVQTLLPRFDYCGDDGYIDDGPKWFGCIYWLRYGGFYRGEHAGGNYCDFEELEHRFSHSLWAGGTRRDFCCVSGYSAIGITY